MWNQINNEVNNICNYILPNNDFNNDLKQEVLIALFNYKGIDKIFNTSKVDVYKLARRIAYRFLYERNQFFNKKILKPFKNTIEFDAYILPQDEVKEITIKDITSELNEIDKLWIELYLSSDCATSQVSHKTGIYRKSVDNRLDLIFNKIRKNVNE